MRIKITLAAAVAVVAVAGCGGSAAHHHPAAPKPIRPSEYAACREIRTDILTNVANGLNDGTPDNLTLTLIAGEVTSPRLARDIRAVISAPTGNLDLSIARQLLVAGIAHDCNAVAVQIPMS